jgi:tetratricopeptide (TPR) repeat protein
MLAVAAGVVLLMGILTPALLAQTATVRGVCKDVQGQPLADATVELVNNSNGLKKDLKTNKKGEYFSLGIPPGPYTYHLIVAGKEIYHLNNVQVGLDQEGFTLDIDMQKEQANAAKGQGLSPEQLKAMQDQKAKQEKENSTVKDLNAKLAIAIPAIKSGDFDTAVTQLTEATQMDATRDVIWANLGVAYLGSASKQTDKDERNKRYDDAVSAFQKAIDLKKTTIKPNDEESKKELGGYYNEIGEAYAREGKIDDAMKTYDQAVQTDPSETARYYYNEGAVLTNAGKVDDAIAAFDKAIAAAPDDPAHADAYYQKGVGLISKATVDKDNKMTAPDGTAEAFNKYLELQPNGPNAENAKQLLASIGAPIENGYGGAKKKTTSKKSK